MVNFEKSLQTLDELVKKMEQGQLPLEESLKNFEQGIKLIRECQTILASAEQKVQMLVEYQNTESLTAFNNDESN